MTTVALVPALDRADSIAETVAALRQVPEVDEVVVIDDGSTDATSERAAEAGARVLRLPRNRGKGGAVTAGVGVTPEAAVYLLVDADVGSTAALAAALLPPVLAGEVDMTIGVLPSAGGRGGFGTVRTLAAAGIRRAVGIEVEAPLSGQRAIEADLLRRLCPLADRFGLETALTIDAVRAGATVREVPVEMEHRHTGRSLAGFAHRGRQGVDVTRALWSRLTTATARLSIIVAATLLVAVAALASASRAEPRSVASSRRAGHVIVFGIPRLGWGDVGTGVMPALDRLVASGAVAATSVRTASTTPSSAEGYASLGAGARVRAGAEAAVAMGRDDLVERSTAAQLAARLTGHPVDGDVVVLGAAATTRLQQGRHLPTQPGALGEALRAAGLRAAVVGNADVARSPGAPLTPRRPAAAAVMRSDGAVDRGSVGTDLLRPDPSAPSGVRADPEKVAVAAQAALGDAAVVVIDPGDTDRAATLPGSTEADHRAAVRATDEVLARVVALAGPDDLVLVVGIDPPGTSWRLAPIVAAGAGVRRGYLHSPSVHRLGVVALTDLAPTILHAVGAPVPDDMIGHPLRFHEATPDLGKLRRLDRDAAFRERIYFPITLGYIIFQALVYLGVMVATTRWGGVGRARPAVRLTVLAVASWPLATFVARAVPGLPRLGVIGADSLIIAVSFAVAALASRSRRHILAPLSWIFGATIALLAIDLALGARLQASSILGYSLHTAARFTGIGNTAFAVLAASTVLLAAAHVRWAPRRHEAVVAVVALFALVIFIDGAPALGDDVGGILTFVPLLGVMAVALSGRRLRARTVALAVAAGAAVVALAAAVDLLRPARSRTHLGQLAHAIAHGGTGPFATTVARKLAANLHTYRTPWNWIVVVLAAYLLFLVGRAGGWARLVPPGSALRVGVIAALVAGLLGNVLNDSGAVVTALVFVSLGPFLTLLALDRGQEPVMIEPAGTPPRPDPVGAAT